MDTSPHQKQPNPKKIRRSIFWAVVALHLIGLSFLVLTPKQPYLSRRSIAVRTLDPLAPRQSDVSDATLTAAPSRDVQEASRTAKEAMKDTPKDAVKAVAKPKKSSSSKKSSKEAPSSAKKQKKKIKEKRVVAKTAPTTTEKKSAAKDKKNSEMDKLLQEVERNLAKISPTAHNSSRKAGGPSTQLAPLNIDLSDDSTLASGARHYREELAARLRCLLQLPEIGNVKVSLTLRRDGKVARMNIISTQSELNRTYLLNTLPLLNFPPFGAEFPGEAERTFPLTLTNDV
jgi:outer membrane biosynthesis protein TonB